MVNSGAPAQAPEHLDPEQQLFQLKTLYDTSRELLSLTDISDILNVLLLMTMGALGTSRGYALIIARDGKSHSIAARGLEEDEISRIQQNIPTIMERRAQEPSPSSSDGTRMLLFNNALDSDIYPRRTVVFVQFTLEYQGFGCLALGEKLTGTPFLASESDLLMSMAHLLVQALNRAHSQKTIKSLNHNLKAQNAQLETALINAKNSGKKLDKQVFHLQTLHDASLELSRLIDVDAMLNAFLLNTLGAFSLTHGYVVLYDQGNHNLWQAARPSPGETAKNITPQEAEDLLFAAINDSDFQNLKSLSAQSIHATAVNGKIVPLLGVGFHLFRLQDSCFGLIGLGPKINAGIFTKDENILLAAHIDTFLLFLNNALSFETISNLNKDLEQKNKQLTATIEELTSSKRRIEVLEQFGSNISSLLKREAEGLKKLTLLDLTLILLAGLFLGILFNFSNPNGISMLPETWSHSKAQVINLEEAQQKINSQNALLIDARPQEFYQQSHVPQAMNLPPALFKFIYGMKLSDVDLERPIIVYGRNISSHYDEEVAWQLKSQGHEQVFIAPYSSENMLDY